MGIIILLLPLILIFFMMQNQRKKAQAQAQLIASLGEGDDVMTTAGMYGTLTWVGKDEAFVEIADGVEIHIAKAAIARKVDMAETEAAKAAGTDSTAAAADVGADDGDGGDDDAGAAPGAAEQQPPSPGSAGDDDEPRGPVSTPKRRWRGGDSK
jgi:preprotein translocase subunit YajC